eukprot:m.296774 g.296774  ORF g.296774 m.296774 type:complete len:595 (+) comp40765_c0_seq4:1891-3675(+)
MAIDCSNSSRSRFNYYHYSSDRRGLSSSSMRRRRTGLSYSNCKRSLFRVAFRLSNVPFSFFTSTENHLPRNRICFPCRHSNCIVRCSQYNISPRQDRRDVYGKYCIESRQSVWSVLAYWYSALLFLAWIICFVVNLIYKREFRNFWKAKEFAVAIFAFVAFIVYCVLLSAMLWINGTEEDCQRHVECLVALACVPVAVFATLCTFKILSVVKKERKAKAIERKRILSSNISQMEFSPDFFMHRPSAASSFEEFAPPIDEDLEEKIADVLVNPDRITVDVKIGQGNFGFVFRGTFDNEKAAIKTIQELDSRRERNDFIQEALIMKTFDHPNVMKLLGISRVSLGSNLPIAYVIVLPYMELGDLKIFLQKRRKRQGRLSSVDTTGGSAESAQSVSSVSLPLSMLEKIQFGHQIAKGMEYLASKKVIHRDLAARNCMIDYDMKLRVSDFGLAKAADYYKIDQHTQLPCRWMAVESLRDFIFTTQSDVWAFGVTLWEIMTLAEVPYAGMSSREVANEVKKGLRLEKPLDCLNETYDLMLECWNAEPQERPKFENIILCLEKTLQSLTGIDYCDFDESKENEGVEEGDTDDVFSPEIIV